MASTAVLGTPAGTAVTRVPSAHTAAALSPAASETCTTATEPCPGALASYNAAEPAAHTPAGIRVHNEAV